MQVATAISPEGEIVYSPEGLLQLEQPLIPEESSIMKLARSRRVHVGLATLVALGLLGVGIFARLDQGLTVSASAPKIESKIEQPSQNDLAQAKQIINETGLGFLIKGVNNTFVPLSNIPLEMSGTLRHLTRSNRIQGNTEYYPDGAEILLNSTNSGSEETYRRTVFHELGHSVDPDLNPYLNNFFSSDELAALKTVTTNLKKIYWQHYFPNDNIAISSVEKFYRNGIASDVGKEFGGSEALGKSLLLGFQQNPSSFDGFPRKYRDSLDEASKQLADEALAAIDAEFALNPFKASKRFPDLAPYYFKLGGILKVAAARHG